MSTDSITITADRYRDLMALQARVDSLVDDARTAKFERDAAQRDLVAARESHAKELDAARRTADRLREQITLSPDAQAQRAEIAELRRQLARYRLLGAAQARIEADLATLRGAYREDGGLR